VVLRGMVREIDVCCCSECIYEQLEDGSVVPAGVEAELKEEFLMFLVEDWSLFGLFASYC
jgi:hypothetical protein